jgi:hypothetical protein
MSRFGSRAFVLWLVCGASVTAMPSWNDPQSATPSDDSQTPVSTPGDLRTFVVQKAPAERSVDADQRASTDSTPAPNQPRSNDVLRTTIGLGYVQGADWGAEMLATGAAAGIQVQLDSLVTKGVHGLLFDHGSLVLNDPDAGWRLEAGDVFSNLRGAARGGRVVWQAAGSRQPALSVYGPRPGVLQQPTVLAYRDQIRVRSQTLLDAEVASDKSYLLRSSLGNSRLDVEAAYRRGTKPIALRDQGLQGGMTVWRGVRVTGSFFRLDEGPERNHSATFSVRLPLSRLFDLTVERGVMATSQGTTTTLAAMGNVNAGQVHLFHRYQRGDSNFNELGLTSAVERDQFQSMASYAPGPRLNVTLQLGTEWRDNGVMQQWEEFQTTVKLTRRTVMQVVTAVPHLLDENRLRMYLSQDLGRQYALRIEYGRPSTFQNMSFERDRPRFKIMLRKTLNVPTPMRGGEVRGRVIDQTGRPVVGARVALGPYTADSGADGSYAFRHVPGGNYNLALEENRLPADYAWDGRQLRLRVTGTSHLDADLLVTPLNAIHGRVFCDRNGNGRFDPGEGVPGAIVHLGDRLTSTDRDGAYSFYNLWPGTYVLTLDRSKLPEAVELSGASDLEVTLDDSRPVTNADFRVIERRKPIVWREIK